MTRDDVVIQGKLLDHEGRPLVGARVRLSRLEVPWKRDLDAYLEKPNRSFEELVSLDYEQSLSQRNALRGTSPETRTDSDGRFLISGLGRDRLVDLVVTAPNVADTHLTVMTSHRPDVFIYRDPAGPPAPGHFPQPFIKQMLGEILGTTFTYRLKPGRSITGVVRDRDSQEPISGMWVGPSFLLNGFANYFQDYGSLAGKGDQPAATDAHGRFSITGMSLAHPELAILAIPQPGRPYLMATARADGATGLVIECVRGVPFRLKVVDESGKPVEAIVEYFPVNPNPHLARLFPDRSLGDRWPIRQAARRAEGVYEGVALPGPGAVVIRTSGRTGYRPAHVDPKAFFAPGRTEWSEQDLHTTYGNQDNLVIDYGITIEQQDYAAIVLVNPPVASRPLELSATVVRDRPRQVTLLDPEGQPIVGVEAWGSTYHPGGLGFRLRASTFAITKLHPERSRRITFVKEDRNLIGSLLARGDGETPYIVRLQPWASITGRILDENGKRLSTDGLPGKREMPARLIQDIRSKTAGHDDPSIGVFPEGDTDEDGRFRIEPLVPGLRYRAEITRFGRFAGVAFEELTLQPGETRELGDIRSKPTTSEIKK